MDEAYRKRDYNLRSQRRWLVFDSRFSAPTIAFVTDQHINHSLLIVDLSGGDKIAPKI